jgi:hypothetical protein
MTMPPSGASWNPALSPAEYLFRSSGMKDPSARSYSVTGQNAVAGGNSLAVMLIV